MILKARERLGFTQSEFSLLVGIHCSTLSRLEKGDEMSYRQVAVMERIVNITDRQVEISKKIFYNQGPLDCFAYLIGKGKGKKC